MKLGSSFFSLSFRRPSVIMFFPLGIFLQVPSSLFKFLQYKLCVSWLATDHKILCSISTSQTQLNFKFWVSKAAAWMPQNNPVLRLEILKDVSKQFTADTFSAFSWRLEKCHILFAVVCP